MTGIWQGFRALTERVRGEFGGGDEWVEPGNWITRAVGTDALESASLDRTIPTTKTYELAPDNVLIATSAPRPAEPQATEADAEKAPAEQADKDRVARAG